MKIDFTMKYYLSAFLILFSFIVFSWKNIPLDKVEIKTSPSNLTIHGVISEKGIGKVSSKVPGENVVDKLSTVNDAIINKYNELVWSDEFNTDGKPDPAKWGYDIGNGSDGWGNHELEYYTDRPENAIVRNGVLKITAIKENYNGMGYTSARLISKNKYAFTYGKVEVRAKLPSGVGTWPAVWMLGSNIDSVAWPGCGEIDIMEQRGRELNKIFGTLHYPERFGNNADGRTIAISNASTEFHIYSLEWSATNIKISVDNKVYQTVENSESMPFNHDFFFLLNIAIGGGFAGNVDPGFTRDSMEIDYIRVYK